jgi:hypothetical protein
MVMGEPAAVGECSSQESEYPPEGDPKADCDAAAEEDTDQGTECKAPKLSFEFRHLKVRVRSIITLIGSAGLRS